MTDNTPVAGNGMAFPKDEDHALGHQRHPRLLAG
jgi:hypothetical protein